MYHTIKRLLGMILVLALVCNMLPLQIFAAEASLETEAPAAEPQEEQTVQISWAS